MKVCQTWHTARQGREAPPVSISLVVRGDVSTTTLEPVNAAAEPDPSLDITDSSTWPEFMRIDEVALVLRVNRSTVDKAIRERLLPVVPGLSSRSTRVHKAALLSSAWWIGQGDSTGGESSPD